MQTVLRQLPQIDKLLRDPRLAGFEQSLLAKIAAHVVGSWRMRIKDKKCNAVDTKKLIEEIIDEYETIQKGSLQPVINATGITVHTNLGRSAIDSDAFEHARKIALGYCNLEYDLEKGCRGDRYSHLSALGKYLFEEYEVLLVNNNAAAVYLILNTFAKNAATIVSRSELVEIGGGFRVPEVMKNAATHLQEVGTTNKTRIRDYEEAITEQSAMLMKVHRSNFSIEGFFEEAGIEEIARLAKEKGLLSYYDLGSAMLSPLAVNTKEKTLQQVCQSGLDLISFSSDKLMGSVQGGLILAKKELMNRLKSNQMLRMLRADKVTIALVEHALKTYLLQSHAQLPTNAMLETTDSQLRQNAQKLQRLVEAFCDAKVVQTRNYSGGGSMPNVAFTGYGVAIGGDPKRLEKQLRANNIIARIENEQVILDVRTIYQSEFETIANVLKEKI